MQLIKTLLLCLIVCSVKGQHIFSRKYKVGDSYRYRLTIYNSYNNAPQDTTVAECLLKVVTDSAGIPFDEITWTSLTTTAGADHARARSVKPYRISLHPKGSIHLPRLEEAGMTGPITDLNTFFVAISPQVGAVQLVNKGDSIIKQEPVIGDFANGKTILKGQDCLTIAVYLKEKTDSTIFLQTNFLPPNQNCISWLTDDMKTAVVDGSVNNFQMVRPAVPEGYTLSYGREQFIITSTINRLDGKLLSAEMSNTLILKMKMQCDSNYANCKGPFPFRIDRKLKLELIF